jgi:cobyrinic acid a,c-diamide synthase
VSAPIEPDLRHHGDDELGPGLIDLAVNVRPGTPPEWLRTRLAQSLGGLAAYPKPEAARAAVADLAASGGIVVGECAGLLYLARELDSFPMCGVLDVVARMTPKLTLGYRTAIAAADSVLLRAGEQVRGHEFHRTACEPHAASADTKPAWTFATNADGSLVPDEGHAARNVHASYLHLHWAGRPRIARRIVEAARLVGPRVGR